MSFFRNSIHFAWSLVPSSLRGECGVLLAAAAPLWIVGGAGGCLGWRWPLMYQVRDGAVALVVMAWVSRSERRGVDRAQQMMVREMVTLGGAVRQSAPRPDRRLHRVR